MTRVWVTFRFYLGRFLPTLFGRLSFISGSTVIFFLDLPLFDSCFPLLSCRSDVLSNFIIWVVLDLAALLWGYFARTGALRVFECLLRSAYRIRSCDFLG